MLTRLTALGNKNTQCLLDHSSSSSSSSDTQSAQEAHLRIQFDWSRQSRRAGDQDDPLGCVHDRLSHLRSAHNSIEMPFQSCEKVLTSVEAHITKGVFTVVGYS